MLQREQQASGRPVYLFIYFLFVLFSICFVLFFLFFFVLFILSFHGYFIHAFSLALTPALYFFIYLRR